MSTLLIYMPALNEEKTIGEVLYSIPKNHEGYDKTILLVVNDGSKDATESEALKSGAVVVNHPYNKGVGAAFQTAIEYALKINASALVSIDADGQFDVNQIQEMIKPISNKTADFCIGNRFQNKRPDNMPKIKFWGNKQVNKIVSFVGKTKIKDASCGFRAYSRECLLNLNLQGQFTYTHETILELLDKGFKIDQISVSVKYFDGRVSRVANNLINYGLQTSKIILKSLKDYTPFYFFGSIALVVFSLSFLLGGFTLFHWFCNGSISPYKSIGIISLALMGMSLLLIIFALLADMLGRIRKNQEKIIYELKVSKYAKENK